MQAPQSSMQQQSMFPWREGSTSLLLERAAVSLGCTPRCIQPHGSFLCSCFKSPAHPLLGPGGRRWSLPAATPCIWRHAEQPPAGIQRPAHAAQHAVHAAALMTHETGLGGPCQPCMGMLYHPVYARLAIWVGSTSEARCTIAFTALPRACPSYVVACWEAHLFCKDASKVREAAHKLLKALHVKHGRLLSHLCLQEGDDWIILCITIFLQHNIHVSLMA